MPPEQAAPINFGKTFFPNSRKECTIDSVTLQKSKNGLNYIKIAFSMPLDDGKQVGMPSWVGADYDRLAKIDCEAGSVKYPDLTLYEMTVDVYPSDDSLQFSQRLVCPTVNAFSMQRGDKPKREGGTPPVWLEGTAYVNYTSEVWAWLPYHFRPDPVYMSFCCTQAELPVTSTPPQVRLAEAVDPEKYAGTVPVDAEFVEELAEVDGD